MGKVSYDFKDKVVLVTGGTSGIGFETASKFARSGATVIITGRDEKKGNEVCAGLACAGSVKFIKADLGNPSEIENLFDTIKKDFGPVDIAVNNASDVSGVGKALHDFATEEFDHAITTNLRGTWLCMKFEIAQMMSHSPSGGSIVNVSSLNGLGGVPGGGIYSAVKAGILAFTKSSAYEMAGSGIRINALVPGANNTPMLKKAIETQGQTEEQKEKVKGMYLNMIPQKRFADPKESADAILWLCSDASSYVTGHSLIVDGGTSCLYR